MTFLQSFFLYIYIMQYCIFKPSKRSPLKFSQSLNRHLPIVYSNHLGDLYKIDIDIKELWFWFSWFMVLSATFNNISVISWRSVVLMEETGVPGENHRPSASHWQILTHELCIFCISEHIIIYSVWISYEMFLKIQKRAQKTRSKVERISGLKLIKIFQIVIVQIENFWYNLITTVH